jgi:hypothetical protein
MATTSAEKITGYAPDLSTKPTEAPPAGMEWSYGNFPDPNAKIGTNEYASSYKNRWVLQKDQGLLPSGASAGQTGVTGKFGSWSGRKKSVNGVIYNELYTKDGGTEWKEFGPGELQDMPAGGSSLTTSQNSLTATAPKTAEQIAADAVAAGKTADRKSAYDLLYEQFNKYGLSSLVEPLKNLITDPGVSPSEFTIRLRETEPYKQRFGANTQRIAKGLRSLNEAEYIGLEDQYQNIMRNYGLPDTYYTKGDLGRQPGFEKFIAGDVSPVELESRIQTAQNRVVKANPEVSAALKQFYPDISSGDILAYTIHI